MPSFDLIKFWSTFFEWLMVKNSQIVLIEPRLYLRFWEMLSFCIISIPKAVEVVFFLFNKLNAAWIVNLIVSLIYNCFLINSKTCSFPALYTRRFITIYAIIILKIDNLNAGDIFVIEFFILQKFHHAFLRLRFLLLHFQLLWRFPINETIQKCIIFRDFRGRFDALCESF